jgi:hypothetical protein
MLRRVQWMLGWLLWRLGRLPWLLGRRMPRLLGRLLRMLWQLLRSLLRLHRRLGDLLWLPRLLRLLGRMVHVGLQQRLLLRRTAAVDHGAGWGDAGDYDD